MKTIYVTAACVVATLFAGMASVSAHEHGKKKEMSGHHTMSAGVEVESAWARATPGLAKNGGGYFVAKNSGKHGDRLLGVSANVSAKAELHSHINDNGVMRMRRLDGVDVPAGGEVAFKPGGHHIMFIGLHKPLKKGDRFPVTLMFEKTGNQTVEVTVMGVGEMKGGMKHDMTPKVGGHHGK